MTKLTKVKRKANVGEQILITNASCTGGQYGNGDILIVQEHCEVVRDLIYAKGSSQPIRTVEYVVIVDKPNNNRRLAEAEAKIATLEAEVAKLKVASKPSTFVVQPCVAKNNADADIERIATELYTKLMREPKKSPNQRRADVIKRAQAFVADMEKTSHIKGVTNLNGYRESYYPQYDEVEYVVNSDKRTVVALLKYTQEQTVWAKSAAKCDPDDVFNADIGKAIALGRALGVKVPKEFTDAVKPTEVEIGHIVKNNHADDLVGGVTEWCPKFDDRRPNGKAFRHTADVGYMHTSRVTIIDDSDAVYL